MCRVSEIGDTRIGVLLIKESSYLGMLANRPQILILIPYGPKLTGPRSPAREPSPGERCSRSSGVALIVTGSLGASPKGFRV